MSGGAELPEKIGRYTIKRKLGEGGQGAVYHAFDPNFNIDVAIKVLHPEYRADEFLERFKVDAQTTVRLTAPNVVRVFDFDLQYPYLVMEYCGDGDLNRYIKSRRRRSLREILSITRQICEALVAAHENDPPILHRDIKPGNVLFQKGVPKVTDFGLAKMLSGSGGLTTTKGMMGTVRYCSPEQLRDASRVDHRADLWSVGVVLYELLTWTRPFDKPGDSEPNIMLRVIMEPPRPTPYEIPGPVKAVIERALLKSADERFGSAREMRDAIDRALAAVPGADGLLLPPEPHVDELSRMAAQVATLLDGGQSGEASTLIREMRRRSSEDSLVGFWQRRVRERSGTGIATSPAGAGLTPAGAEPDLVPMLDSIQSLITSRNYTEARREIGKILIEQPDNSIVHRLLEKLSDEERRLRGALDQAYRDAEKARAEGSPARVHEVWKGFNDAYPDLPVAQAELAVATRELAIQEQRRAREAATRAVADRRAAGDLQGALTELRRYTALYPADQEAAREEQDILGTLRARERAERVATTGTAAGRLRSAGDLRGALALWEQVQRDDPAATEAARAADGLRVEIAARERQDRLQEARSRAAACVAAQDLRGAASAWEAFRSGYPDDAEAKHQVESLGREIAQREREAALADIHRLLVVSSSRLEGRRYASLAAVAASVARIVEKAHAALSGDASALAGARTALMEAGRDAEAALGREVAGQRQRLQGMINEHREWLPREGARAGGSASPGERGLQDAFAAALHELCSARPPDSPGDPLQPLARAAGDLAAAAAALTRERQQAVVESRTRAAGALEGAERALQSLAAAGTGADDRTSGPPQPAFEERLGHLRGQVDSNVPARLDEVARQAAALRAEIDAARVEALWDMTRDLGRLLGEARSLAFGAGGEKLAELVRRATQAFEAGAGSDAASPRALSALRQELRGEIDAGRRARDERLEQAGGRWRKAQQTWRDVLVADLGTAHHKEAERVAASGEAAFLGSRPEELESWAAQLEGLTRRYRLESAWIEKSNALLEIEGPLDHDGLPQDEGDPETRNLLARYRKAMASGDGAAIKSLGPVLETHSADLRREDAGPAKRVSRLPDVTPGVRRFNERYAPGMLKGLGELTTRYESCRSQGRQGEAARIAAEIEKAHARLLAPPPLWKRPALHAGVAAVLAAVAIWIARPTGRFSVTVVSPGGEIRVAEVRGGQGVVEGLVTDVPEEGVVWPDLPPGRYIVTLASGVKREFEVPDAGVVLLPGNDKGYTDDLVTVLGLNDPAGRH